MHARRTALAACCIVAATAGSAAAQSAIDRLEQDVRSRLGQAPGPIAQVPASEEPGYLGIVADDRQDRGRGVRVLDALNGGPAHIAGVRPNDLIVEVNGQPIRTMEEFVAAVKPLAPGQRVTFAIDRAGTTLSADVVLGRRPPAGDRPYEQFGQQPGASPPVDQSQLPPLGMRVGPVSPASLDAPLNPARGVVVLEVVPASPAYKAGIPTGAVIVSVDGKRVEGVPDFSMLAADSAADGEVRVAYYHLGVLYERKLAVDTTAMSPLPPSQTNAPLVLRPNDDATRIEQLEDRVRFLEQRLIELERRLGMTPAEQ